VDADRGDLEPLRALLPLALSGGSYGAAQAARKGRACAYSYMSRASTKRRSGTKSGGHASASSGRHTRPTAGPAIITYVILPLLLACLMAYYLSLARAAAGEVGFPLDDSWIHARFAENLAHGPGFSFNPGQPTSTTTAALWTIVYAGAYRLSHEFLFTAFVLNWLFCALLCVTVYHLALTMHPSRWAAAAAAALVALTVPLAWWALSGMEPPLYGFLSVLGILLHVRLRYTGGVRTLLPTIVFALAGLARPECLLLFPLSLIDRLAMSGPRQGRLARWLKEVALHIPVFVLLIAPVFIYNLRVTGLPLPSSYYSKLQRLGIPGALAGARGADLPAALLRAPFRELWDLIVVWAGDNLVLILPFFIGLVWLVRQARLPDGRHRSLLIPMVLVVQPVLWALLAGYRPPGFQSQRYLANLNPLFVLLGVMGGVWVVGRIALLRAWQFRLALVAAALIASLARQPDAAHTYMLNVKNITEMQVTVGRWLRDNAAKGSLLALNDVGAIAVITGDPVLDLQGLVTPEILPLRSLKQIDAGAAPRLVFHFLAQRRPDYLAIFPRWYPELATRGDLFTPVFMVSLRHNITCGDATMAVYRATWPEQKGRAGPRPAQSRTQ
jgi:hypothetical protein